MTNNKWCDPRNVTNFSQSCSLHLEHLTIMCRPFYLPCEFTSVVIAAVYIPPQAHTDISEVMPQEVINRQQHWDPGAAFIVARDLNRAKPTRVMSDFKQHILFPTRRKYT